MAGAAYTEIRALAAAKAIKLQAFFSQYKKPICQVKRVAGLESACIWVLCVYIENGIKGQNCSIAQGEIGRERNDFKKKNPYKHSRRNGKSLTL